MTIYKNYGTKTLFLILPAFLILEICMLVFSLTNGWLKEKIKGYISIVRLRETLNKNRAFIQKNRILSDKQIISDFSGVMNIKIYNNWGVKFIINPFLSVYWNFIKVLI